MIVRFESIHTVRLDPTLSALWRESLDFVKAVQQNQIDALTAKVSELTARLNQSSSDLQGSVEASKENQ